MIKEKEMEDMVRFDTVGQYSAYNNNETMHPLVNIVDLSKAAPRMHKRMHMGIYTILLKEIKCGDLRYGCNYYDYEEGTLVFLAPGQVIGVENNGGLYQPQGLALVIHPDFLSWHPFRKAYAGVHLFLLRGTRSPSPVRDRAQSYFGLLFQDKNGTPSCN